MGRKTRKEMPGEDNKPTKYADSAPRWIRKLAEEVEELAEVVPGEKRWKAPGRVYLQFSKKDPRKEEQRHEAIQRQRSRAATRR